MREVRSNRKVVILTAMRLRVGARAVPFREMQSPGARKGSKVVGCGLGLTFAAALATFIYVVTFTNSCARFNGVETFPLNSSASHFNPFASIDEIRNRVGLNAHLVSIEASYVRSDGTMDLTASYKPAPNVKYSFAVPLDKGPVDMPPVGAGRKPGDVWVQLVDVNCYLPGQMVYVSRMSGRSSSQFSYHNEGMDIKRRRANMATLEPDIGQPKVSTLDLWNMALSKGAPKDAVATIRFDTNGYKFAIAALNIQISLDANGKPINH